MVSRYIPLSILLLIAAAPPTVNAQQAIVLTPDGKHAAMPGGELVIQGVPNQKPETPAEKPAPDGKPAPKGERPEEGVKKPDEKAKPSDIPAVTKRPQKPVESPRPEELRAKPGPDGKLRFDFRGQPWPDVLQWLADVSSLSLDWQEVPGDYLNLTTQRGFTIDETRDLINRHLLARGFTMLLRDEVLSVVKTEKINAALVPRVEPEELARRMPYEFVKVSFPLESLVAENSVAELKPMLSSNGQLTALKTTNRLEALDAVINLREIHAVLQREQSLTGQERLVQEFVLKCARAEDVYEQLMGLLGLDSKRKSSGAQAGGMAMDQMQQWQQRQAQMMQEMQQRGGQPQAGGFGGDQRNKSEVHLVVNQRRNSILAQATPDKMAIVALAIKTIDVPLDRERTLLSSVNRMQVYRLASLDPEAVVKTLEETGDLDPTTSLQVDKKHKSIIAYASLADHLTIRTLVQKLDGSSRRFEVLRLRKLAADYVAGSINFMMGTQEEPKEERPRFWGYYGMGHEGNTREKDEDHDKFRVDADVENNRLLLWANEVEMAEVRNLLVKLGELPPPGGNSERVRVLDLAPGEQTEELLERLRKAWPSLAPNKLLLPPPAKAAPSEAAPGTPQTSPPAPAQTEGKQADREGPSPVHVRFAQLRPADLPAEPVATREAPDPPAPPVPAGVPGPDTTAETPPVQLSIGADGRVVISSPDTQALDLLEELIGQAAPPRKEFKLFTLKYASAYWVRLNLEDFFRDEDKKDKNARRSFFFDFPQPEKKKEANRLSQRKKLKLIDDFDTNTLLVVGATAEQLRTIEELILLWDKSPPRDSESARVTAVFEIRYSKASIIADAVKDVYRDLLSSTDKALQSADKRPTNQTTYMFGDSGGDDGPRRTQVSFKGKLSIGVDEISNTLLVSSEGQNLMDNVRKMIEGLDEAAKPTAEMRVVTLGGGMNAERVREVLSRVLGQETGRNTQRPGTQPRDGQQPGGRKSGSAGGTNQGRR